VIENRTSVSCNHPREVAGGEVESWAQGINWSWSKNPTNGVHYFAPVVMATTSILSIMVLYNWLWASRL